MNFITKMLAVAALALVPVAGSAAIVQIAGPGTPALPPAASPVNEPISAPVPYLFSFIATGTDDKLFTLTADAPMIVNGIVFSSTGSLANVNKTSFSFDGGAPVTFSGIGSPTFANAFEFISPFSLASGEAFTFQLFANGLTSNTNLSVYFETTPIPVPAALPLLLAGVAALGVASRKKRA